MIYSTENKSISQVIKETNQLLNKHKIKGDLNGKYKYDVKFKSGNAILKDIKGDKYYAFDMFNVYGPFDDFDKARLFLKIINTHTEAHQQAMWKSWENEGSNFCKPVNAYA